jgi:hypothetical protein
MLLCTGAVHRCSARHIGASDAMQPLKPLWLAQGWIVGNYSGIICSRLDVFTKYKLKRHLLMVYLQYLQTLVH